MSTVDILKIQKLVESKDGSIDLEAFEDE